MSAKPRNKMSFEERVVDTASREDSYVLAMMAACERKGLGEDVDLNAVWDELHDKATVEESQRGYECDGGDLAEVS